MPFHIAPQIASNQPHFAARYLLRGHQAQMDELTKAAASQNLPFLYAETREGHVWAVATGKEDTEALKGHLEKRAGIYAELQTDLNELVDEEILDVLTHWKRKKPSDLNPIRNTAAWVIPADGILEKIKSLDLPRQSRALIQSSSVKLEPLFQWLDEHYGRLPQFWGGPSSYEAVNALPKGLFNLETGVFSFTPLHPTETFQAVVDNLFQPKTIQKWFGRVKHTFEHPSFEAKAIENFLNERYPNTKPNSVSELVRSWQREGLLDHVKKAPHLLTVSKLGLQQYQEALKQVESQTKPN
jgi:hypothetical protein